MDLFVYAQVGEDDTSIGAARRDTQQPVFTTTANATIGGHHLRSTVHDRNRITFAPKTSRPRSLLSPSHSSAPGSEVRRVLNLNQPPTPPPAPVPPAYTDILDHEEYEDEFSEESDGVEVVANPLPPPQTDEQATSGEQPYSLPGQPFRTTHIPIDSALGHASATLYTTAAFAMARALAWQADVAGNPAKLKVF